MPAEDSERRDEPAFGDELRRFLNPLDVIVITRERLQDALDDAVRRGRMTRDDATDLLSELMRRGRRQTDEVIADLERLLEGARGAVTAPTERVRREVDRARRAAGIGPSFPIIGYDDLTAAQVVERVDDLSTAELRQVREYERRNANRKSVLAALDGRLA